MNFSSEAAIQIHTAVILGVGIKKSAYAFVVVVAFEGPCGCVTVRRSGFGGLSGALTDTPDTSTVRAAKKRSVDQIKP